MVHNSFYLTIDDDIHLIFVMLTYIESVYRKVMKIIPQKKISRSGEPSARTKDDRSKIQSKDVLPKPVSVKDSKRVDAKKGYSESK